MLLEAELAEQVTLTFRKFVIEQSNVVATGVVSDAFAPTPLMVVANPGLMSIPVPRTDEFAPAAPCDTKYTSPSSSHGWFVTPLPVVNAAEPNRIAAVVLPAVPERMVHV